MKKNILFFFFLFSFFFVTAQKELWSVNSGYPGNYSSPPPFAYPPYFGNITKYDINGENPVIMHEFDEVNGKTPIGRLFQVSNGKLYGTTSEGGLGIGAPGIWNGYGTLFEYDLILNKFRVVKFLDTFSDRNPQIGFIEPVLGKLYSASTGKLLVYNIATEITNSYGQLEYLINSELVKASDGNLYGTVIFPPQNCPNSSSSSLPYNGSIFKVNTTNNTINLIYSLSCNWEFGAKPSGELVEGTPGKLYGTTFSGGLISGGNLTDNYGTLFEYTIATNTFTKKFDFNNITTGKVPYPLVKGTNGKLYGICNSGGINPDAPTQEYGTIFEYTPTTNNFSVVHNFGLHFNSVGTAYFSGIYPISIMKSSIGNFFCTSINQNSGISKYDPVTNICEDSLVYTSYLPNSISPKNLIEICRKPSYQEILINTFNPCAGSTFTYNVQNTNATSYVWKKGVTALPTQTTAILNLENVTAGDNGVYTCTMVNECGTTITMPLTVTVGCLNVNEIENYKNNITLFPNPTKGNLNIKIPEQNNLTISNITISNMLGQLVYNDSLNRNLGTTKIIINVTKLETGIYNVVLKTDKGDWNGKFVKN